MENASKALIIAASVLVTLMIIALGVTIFSKAQGAADTTSLDTAEISMFNSKFERYANNQSGSQVKSLISFAISNASINKDEPSKLPSFAGIGTAAGSTTASNDIDTYIKDLSNIRNNIQSTHTYDVKMNYAGTGLIDIITINY